MSTFISPAVVVTESEDLGSVVSTITTIGALAGKFNWGPVEKPYTITAGETELASVFSRPTDDNYLDFMIAADFLTYTSSMQVVRAAGTNARNAVPTGQTAVLIKNSDELGNADLSGTQFLATYPGALGNGLIIDVADPTKFADWEYQTNFEYAPLAGEFAIAVIDGSGKWTGAGGQTQIERLAVTSKASGGVSQAQSLTLTGTAAGGIKQDETITFTGTATDTTLVIDGVSVTIAVGDTATIVAGKVATALAAIPSTYLSTAQTGATVRVVFAVPGARTKIATANQSGISAVSVINTSGNTSFNISLYGDVITLTNGDTAAASAAKIAAALAALTSKYVNVSQPTATSVAYQYVASGSQTIVASQVISGLTIATAITTPANSVFNITVFGVSVALTNGDSTTTVATKIAAALNAADLDNITNIAATGASVTYSYPTVGKKTAQTVPATQGGVAFILTVTQTGRLGTLLEKYELVSPTKGSKLDDGTSNYFVDLLSKSSYVTIGDSTIALTNSTTTLAGGVDDNDVNVTNAMQDLVNAEAYDVNYLILGGISAQEQDAGVTIVETRGDCLAFASPPLAACVGNKGNEVADITAWRSVDMNRESSFLFNDANWGYMYDKYNDTYRWVPCCGGTAGLKAACDTNYYPWTSPAGSARGLYKNYLKLGWSPNKAQRDSLYTIAINPVVNFPAQGIMLYGDKTSVTRPSVFGYVNVRSSFIVAEKTLANYAAAYLFELNDDTTRTQFANAVRPFLRTMKAQNAFENVKFVCDTSNNDGTVRANKQLVGSVYLQPTNSINFVTLNFTAISTGVDFTTVYGTPD